MSSTAEARFRLQAGASVARRVTVTSLDPATDGLVRRLAARPRTGVTFVSPSQIRGASDVAASDLVVMVVAAGADASAAARIGYACSEMRTHTATLVVRPPSTTDEALSRTLAQVRPWSLMVVVASDEEYVEDILRSLR